MQQKLESNGVFLRRTDRLAAHLGVTVSKLTEVLNLSNGMLFAYRTGKHPISSKAWSKLEAAERKAGIRQFVPEADSVQLPSPQAVESFVKANPAEATGLVLRLLEAQQASRELVVKILGYEKTAASTDEVAQVQADLAALNKKVEAEEKRLPGSAAHRRRAGA